MRHLSLEDLARLVDEAADPGEDAHLRDCIACRLELAEMRAQTEALAELPEMAPPPALWAAIEARLNAEGLASDIRPAPQPLPVRRAAWWRPSLRTAAAAVLLIGAGAAGGWLGRGRPRDAVSPSGGPIAAAPATEGDGPGTPSAPSRQPEVAPAGEHSTQAGRAPDVSFAATGTAPRRTARPQSPEALRAERALRKAEADYAAALRRYAELADPASGADAATRLRALDGIVAATRDALNRDPGDPVANGFHLAATEERQRVLGQVAAQNESTWY